MKHFYCKWCKEKKTLEEYRAMMYFGGTTYKCLSCNKIREIPVKIQKIIDECENDEIIHYRIEKCKSIIKDLRKDINLMLDLTMPQIKRLKISRKVFKKYRIRDSIYPIQFRNRLPLPPS